MSREGTDGQPMADNPDLTAQAEADLAACKAETPPVAAAGVRGSRQKRLSDCLSRPATCSSTEIPLFLALETNSPESLA